MGREYNIHGSKSVRRSWGKHMETMWILLWSFDFILLAMEEPLVLHWEINNQMWKLWEAHPDGYIKNGQETEVARPPK